MATEFTVSGAHPAGERAAGPPARTGEPVALDSFAGRIAVQWAPDEAVTALGQPPFFIDFLKQSDLFEPFVAEALLRYSSPNAPQVRDVLGTLLLAMVNGATRYSHVNAVRHDGVNPGLLDMRRVCSDNAVLRAVGRMEKQEAERWLRRHLSQAVRPLVQERAGRQGWAEAGQGWQAAEAELQLSGWGRGRKRRPAEEAAADDRARCLARVAGGLRGAGPLSAGDPECTAVERSGALVPHSQPCLPQISRREDPEAAPRASSGLIQGPHNQS